LQAVVAVHLRAVVEHDVRVGDGREFHDATVAAVARPRFVGRA
jgi:hypothetical protein